MVAFWANESLSSEILVGPLDESESAEVPLTAGVYKERVSLTEEGANTEVYNLDLEGVKVLSLSVFSPATDILLVLLLLLLFLLVGICDELDGLETFVEMRGADSTDPFSSSREYNFEASSSELDIVSYASSILYMERLGENGEQAGLVIESKFKKC